MCIRSARNFDDSDMDEGLFRAVIDESVPHLRYVSLDGPGETIMKPEAFRMIRYAKSKGLCVMLSTNAALLDSCLADSILSSGLDLIIFSVNGATSDVYADIHGCDCYEAVLSNVRGFLMQKRRARSKILVVVQMIRLPETIPQVSAFYKTWRHLPGVNMVRVKKDVVRNRQIWLNDTSVAAHHKNPCPRLWLGPAFIETNGDVYACPGVMYKTDPVGNVRKNTLVEIWNGARMQSLRGGAISSDLSEHPECSACAYPQPRLPLIMASFVIDPFVVGKMIPLVEQLAFWRGIPLFEK